jgi:hypothetical protein
VHLSFFADNTTALSTEPTVAAFEQNLSCNFPGAPAHSTIQFTDDGLEHGTVASYSCERGFELLGPQRRVCDNGQWLPEGIPFCGEYSESGSPDMMNHTHSAFNRRQNNGRNFLFE